MEDDVLILFNSSWHNSQIARDFELNFKSIDSIFKMFMLRTAVRDIM
jgi:hypothetical protein